MFKSIWENDGKFEEIEGKYEWGQFCKRLKLLLLSVYVSIKQKKKTKTKKKWHSFPLTGQDNNIIFNKGKLVQSLLYFTIK